MPTVPTRHLRMNRNINTPVEKTGRAVYLTTLTGEYRLYFAHYLYPLVRLVTMAAPRISKLTFGRNANAIGIGQNRPLLSWRFEQDDKTSQKWKQTVYEIKCNRNGKITTHRIDSSENVDTPWPEDEPALESRESAEVSIRAYSTESAWTEWYSATVEAALLHPSDWVASVISSDLVPPAKATKRPFYLRSNFSLDKVTGAGRIYATALGVYEIKINGKQIGDHVLAPGWQSYNHRLHYQTYEIDESILNKDDNVIEVVVGEGWYSGRLTWAEQNRNVWGSEIGARVQVELDGNVVAATDASWEWSYGPMLSSELYDGEVYDIEQESSEWRQTKTIPLPVRTKLVAPEAPPIRPTEILKPIELIKTPSRKTIIDFGQNLVGWVKIRNIPARSAPNECIVLRFAEVLEKGELGVRPLRSAKATDKVFLGDKSLAEWEPTFTTHGFRYCEVSGPASLIDQYAENFEAVVVHSSMEKIGDFECSHELVNQLHRNAVWSLRGNFVGLPTDCPQRDERYFLCP
jgi:alpha-L-rhamnosidase